MSRKGKLKGEQHSFQCQCERCEEKMYEDKLNEYNVLQYQEDIFV